MNKRVLTCLSPLLFLLLTSFGPKVIVPNYDSITITSSLYGPFSKDDGVKNISFKMEYLGSNNISVREGLYVIADGKIINRSLNEYHTLIPFKSVTKNLVFDTSIFQNYSYITLHFFVESTSTTYYDKEFELFEKRTLEVDVMDYPTSYQTPRTCFNISSNSYEEKYDFTNVSHTFPDDYYYELNLSKLSFDYTFQQAFTYKRAYLRFKDPSNYFNHITVYDTANLYKRFLLTIKQSGTKISFTPHLLYYDEKTMSLSTFQLLDNSLKETNHLFLPLKQKDNLKGMEFELVVEEAGINKLTLYSMTTLNPHFNLFGECFNSDYCVTGEQHD